MSKHPARFSDALLPVIDRMLGDADLVLDPFAGTGRIHELQPRRITVGVEIEPEWANLHEDTYVGDATALPFPDETFDAIATSPTYGNRMADTYDGRDGSKRNTYRTALGRTLSPNNSGSLQWGDEYRALHEKAWAEAVRVLKTGGVFVLNIKDHVRNGEVQHVTAWHTGALAALGLRHLETERVPLRGNGFGANGSVRVPYESVIAFKKAS